MKHTCGWSGLCKQITHFIRRHMLLGQFHQMTLLNNLMVTSVDKQVAIGPHQWYKPIKPKQLYELFLEQNIQVQKIGNKGRSPHLNPA